MTLQHLTCDRPQTEKFRPSKTLVKFHKQHAIKNNACISLKKNVTCSKWGFRYIGWYVDINLTYFLFYPKAAGKLEIIWRLQRVSQTLGRQTSEVAGPKVFLSFMLVPFVRSLAFHFCPRLLLKCQPKCQLLPVARGYLALIYHLQWFYPYHPPAHSQTCSFWHLPPSFVGSVIKHTVKLNWYLFNALNSG